MISDAPPRMSKADEQNSNFATLLARSGRNTYDGKSCHKVAVPDNSIGFLRPISRIGQVGPED